MIETLRVAPGDAARLRARETAETFGLDKHSGRERLDALRPRLEDLQGRLWAEGARAVLVLLQGLDASGKDGVIRRVFSGLNPQGVQVTSFRAPTEHELAHDYLWRVHAALPPRGYIGVFNRSHYEDVVTVRHLELAPPEVWRRRPAHINAWERQLVDEGTELVKVFLHVSRDEQRRRLQERIDDPAKNWKFRRGDLDVLRQYDDYLAAYEDALSETSTEWAPWHVVPADRNWVKALAVAELLADTLERLDPQFPEPEPGIEGLRVE